ncbi:TetR/AcrR family transcriptional regulator [Nocardia mangyaensis]|uniref:TetR/AcrR family transcriptional regulator n=1 Tax=Nocardia mangyaensis TaxID=2213200 RepID=UPI0014312A40|nr:TetR/AcrR family transcriptional regulator [Nocardia mangyaensis]
MLTDEEDLTAAARIRNAALEGFALNGVAATSIRDVATRAGVSPGLVQHHFQNKDNLRKAVNDYVTRVGAEAIGGRESGTATEAEPAQDIGNRLTAWLQEHRLSLLYVIRAAAEGDDSALQIFDTFVEMGDSQLGRLADEGLLRENLDRRWAVLHVIIMNLATAMLEPAINRYLEAPLRDAKQLERWNRASTEMFRSGFFRWPQ